MEFYDQFQLTFSCQFDHRKFPFGSQECDLKYGDITYKRDKLTLNATVVIHNRLRTTFGQAPILIRDSRFDIEVKSLPPFIKFVEFEACSYAGIRLLMKRKSVGQLLSGYYYPTASFAIVSSISFLINPDVVCI